MKTTLLAGALAILLLSGCGGTTGKQYDLELKIFNNENCTINIDPEITSDSGDSEASSTTGTEVPVSIPVNASLQEENTSTNETITRDLEEETQSIPEEAETTTEVPTEEETVEEGVELLDIKSPSVEEGAKESYVTQVDGKNVLVLLYIGQHNGGLSSWNDTRDKGEFPSQFTLTVPGCYEDLEITYDGSRYEKGSKDLVVRPSISKWASTGTAVMTRCESKTAYLVY